MNETRNPVQDCRTNPSQSLSGKPIRRVRWGLAEPANPQNSRLAKRRLRYRLGEFKRFLSFGRGSGFYFLSFFLF